MRGQEESSQQLSAAHEKTSEDQDSIITKESKIDQLPNDLSNMLQKGGKTTQDEKNVYDGLCTSDEIRLIHLQPRSAGESIRCTTGHVKLSDNPSYEALSYMWGPGETTQGIFINDMKVDIRQNLGFALQHLRLETESRLLWIDAICINQKDIRERNHQVAQMSKIYHQAIRVVVWLGLSNSKSKAAFKVLNLPSNQWNALLEVSDDHATNSERNRNLASIAYIMSLEYWNRLWIIQETLLAKELILQCGDDNCDAFRICWLVEKIRAMKMDLQSQFLPRDLNKTRGLVMEMLDKTMAAQLLYQKSRSIGYSSWTFQPATEPLFRLFSDYNTAKCADKRDKVFGLHSLASTCCKEANPINYSLGWDLILKNLLIHQVRFHQPSSRGLEVDNLCLQTEPQSLVARQRNPPRDHLRIGKVNSFQQLYYEAKLDMDHESLDLIALQEYAQKYVHWPMIEKPSSNFIELVGYARGRLCYKSPILNQASSYEDLELPELTPALLFQMAAICSLSTSLDARHPHATTEADLVDHIAIVNVSDISDMSEKYGLFSKPYGSINYPGKPSDPSPFWVSQYDRNTRIQDFNNLLLAAGKCAGPNQVLAFEEHGLIFLAPEDIKIGDVVCQFDSSDILAVIQGENEINMQCETVNIWRGVSFLASRYFHSTYLAEYNYLPSSRPLSPLEFKLNSSSIWKLCRKSRTPNGDHNIPPSIPTIYDVLVRKEALQISPSPKEALQPPPSRKRWWWQIRNFFSRIDVLN